MIIEKPAGLPSVPRKGAQSNPELADSVEHRIRHGFPGATGPISVHRLDFETSGLIVAALDRPTHRALSRQFMHRKVGKTYAAVLVGHVQDDEGAVDQPLTVDWPNRPKQHINYERGRHARTLFRVVERFDTEHGPRTCVDFRPLTGRTHQLRVHAAAPIEQGGLGCPIVGETLYGTPDSPAQRADRLHLHADHLAFWQPGSGVWQKFYSPAPFARQPGARPT
ncbi:MAG: RluA family pseudouridine synthase [Planctomycetota bacterium]